MPQVFRPRANALVSVVLFSAALVVVAATVAAVLVSRSPYATAVNYTPEQPVPFSHQHHVGVLGIDCRYCHTGVEQSSFAGIPPTHTCMTCHSQIFTDQKMLAPVRASLMRDEPIHWVRVHDLADFVYFNHRIHVQNGIGCESCHGRVDEMALMRQAKPLTMSWCLDCHEDPAPNLRPKDKVYDLDWQPPPKAERAALGRDLMRRYGIHAGRLTNCTVCHR